MAGLRDEGLAAAIGVAPGPANGFTLDRSPASSASENSDWAMVILNPLEPWPGELCLDSAAEHDVRVITRVVDYGGLFWGDVLPGHQFADGDHRRFRPDGWVEAGYERLERMRPYAAAAELTTIQLACQWNLAHPAVECVAPTLIQEAGPQATAIEDKRAELAALPDQCLGRAEVEAIAAIGDNRGSMALKGASPEHEGPEWPDRWPLEPQLIDAGRRYGVIRSVTCAAPRRPAHPLSPLERFAAWIITGPVGRVAAFFADLAVYSWRWVRGREADRRER